MSQRVDPDKPPVADIAAAEAGVARAGEAFSASLRDASVAGHETAERVVSVVRPLLIGAGVLVGVVVTVRLLRGPRRPHYAALRAAPADPFLSGLVRTGAIALATMLGRRLAVRWFGASGGRLVSRIAGVLAVVLVLARAGVAYNV